MLPRTPQNRTRINDFNIHFPIKSASQVLWRIDDNVEQVTNGLNDLIPDADRTQSASYENATVLKNLISIVALLKTTESTFWTIELHAPDNQSQFVLRDATQEWSDISLLPEVASARVRLRAAPQPRRR